MGSIASVFSMFCVIYKSRKKPDAYLYLSTPDDFSHVPEALMAMFGEPEQVMELELSPERRLAREDVNKVMEALAERGWFLQMPPRPGASTH